MREYKCVTNERSCNDLIFLFFLFFFIAYVSYMHTYICLVYIHTFMLGRLVACLTNSRLMPKIKLANGEMQNSLNEKIK